MARETRLPRIIGVHRGRILPLYPPMRAASSCYAVDKIVAGLACVHERKFNTSKSREILFVIRFRTVIGTMSMVPSLGFHRPPFNSKGSKLHRQQGKKRSK